MSASIVVAVWGAQLFVYLGDIILNPPAARWQSRRCNLQLARELDTVPVFFFAPPPVKRHKRSVNSEVTR